MYALVRDDTLHFINECLKNQQFLLPFIVLHQLGHVIRFYIKLQEATVIWFQQDIHLCWFDQ